MPTRGVAHLDAVELGGLGVLREVEQPLLDERVPGDGVARHHDVLGEVAVELERAARSAARSPSRTTLLECEVRVVVRNSTGVSNCSQSSKAGLDEVAWPRRLSDGSSRGILANLA